jgi:hypothetical protein
MNNKILLAGALCIFSSLVQANESDKSLFTCLDLQQYSVNQDCTSGVIENTKSFKDQQKQLELKLEQPSKNVIATTQFFPEQMLIKVIAQREAEKKSKLVAITTPANNTQS